MRESFLICVQAVGCGSKLLKMLFVFGELLRGLCSLFVVTLGSALARSGTSVYRFELLGLNPQKHLVF